MKPFEGYKAEQQTTAAKLPAGCYVAKILSAKVEGNEPDQQLKIAVDITEGEFTGFYKKQFDDLKAQPDLKYEPKYKGFLALQIPNSSNPNRQHTEWDLKSFNNAMWCIEQSNPGYRWDWNEARLKGLTVGINVREGVFNGNPFTKIGRFEVADDVRKGIAKPMKPMKERGTESAPVQPQFTPVDDDEDIPF